MQVLYPMSDVLNYAASVMSAMYGHREYVCNVCLPLIKVSSLLLVRNFYVVSKHIWNQGLCLLNMYGSVYRSIR